MNEVEFEFGVPIPGRILAQESWTKTALKRLPEPPLDPPALFGRSAPLIVELGCGNGRYTLLSALQRPHCNHLGLDLLPAVIRYATRRANQRGLQHVRFAVKDAQTFVARYLPPGSVSEFHLYHPQPYPERRQARLRLVTPAFLAALHRALAPGGGLVLQTDSPEYWHYMRKVVKAFFLFQEQAGPWPDAPEGRSRREILARSRGLKVFRGAGQRRDDLSAEELGALVSDLPLPTFVIHRRHTDLDRLETEGRP